METDGTLNEKQELILNLSDDSYSLQKRAGKPTVSTVGEF